MVLGNSPPAAALDTVLLNTEDKINIRILRSGSKAHCKGDFQKKGSCRIVVFPLSPRAVHALLLQISMEIDRSRNFHVDLAESNCEQPRAQKPIYNSAQWP